MLTQHEILRIVDDYIGVDAGNLENFTYKTLKEFYPRYCGLDIDPTSFEGTKRAQFIAILAGASQRDQARILRGLLAKLPKEARETAAQQAAGSWIESVASRLEGSAVSAPSHLEATEVVRRALEDAESLVKHNDPVSAVDRVHTALHGYLKHVCRSAEIEAPDDASLPQLYKRLRASHPAFAEERAHKQQVDHIVNALAQAVDSLGTIRNRGSVAHPNDNLIGKHEANLVRNAAYTILTYLSAKIE